MSIKHQHVYRHLPLSRSVPSPLPFHLLSLTLHKPQLDLLRRLKYDIRMKAGILAGHKVLNAAEALQQADKFDQANALLGDAHKKGLLTEAREYRALYSGYLNSDGKWKEAVPVISDGVAKGILPQDAELAKAYMIVAQNAYAADDMALAVEMYGKAGPIAADGEAWLNLAKVYEYQNKTADAKAAAQKALDKGVKKPEEARRLLSK